MASVCPSKFLDSYEGVEAGGLQGNVGGGSNKSKDMNSVIDVEASDSWRYVLKPRNEPSNNKTTSREKNIYGDKRPSKRLGSFKSVVTYRKAMGVIP